MKMLPANAMGILADNPDAPGLTPCVQQLVARANQIGMPVYWIHNGWDGLLSFSRNADKTGQSPFIFLNPPATGKPRNSKSPHWERSRTLGCTVNLHLSSDHRDLSRRKPAKRKKIAPEKVKKILGHLGIEVLVTIGSDETLSVALQMDHAGVPVIAIPKPWSSEPRQG